MRRVAAEVGTLVQSLAYEADVAFFEITHAPVDELRRAARRRFGEIGALDESGAVTARHGVDRRPEARRTPADDDDVEVTLEPGEEPVPIHRCEAAARTAVSQLSVLSIGRRNCPT